MVQLEEEEKKTLSTGIYVYVCRLFYAVQLVGYLFSKSDEGIELKRTRLIPMKW